MLMGEKLFNRPPFFELILQVAWRRVEQLCALCTMHLEEGGGGILLQLQARVAQSISINSPCELLIAIIHNASEAHWLRQGISWNSQICWPRRANSNDVENCGLLLSTSLAQDPLTQTVNINILWKKKLNTSQVLKYRSLYEKVWKSLQLQGVHSTDIARAIASAEKACSSVSLVFHSASSWVSLSHLFIIFIWSCGTSRHCAKT